MSKRKNPKREMKNKIPNRLIQAFHIPLPDELKLPIIVDVTGLRAIATEVNQLNDQVTKLRKEAIARQNIEVVPQSVVKAFSTIATNTWRAKTRMIDQDTGEIKEEMKRVYRHIEAIVESLKQIGVEIIDPVGRVYDSGMALKVVTFEPTPGLSTEEIKETIKPSVAWQGRLIQIGEVIVGTP